MPVKHTAKEGRHFQKRQQKWKREGSVVNEGKSGAFGGNFFDTKDIPE
jgi:hypothetical protein